MKGGHLASFGSLKEQKDVESWMQASFLLLPNFHKVYWIGLKSSEFDWPLFRWLDATKSGFSNWGAIYYPYQVRAAGAMGAAAPRCSAPLLCS
jgi:hypothetical protein